MPPVIRTVREQIAWSYANLARAHAAKDDGVSKYNRTHHIVRNKLFHGLISDKMKMRSLYDDERMKMVAVRACFYCGSAKNLGADHLIPRIRSGPDESDNLVLACRSCNSSKRDLDLMQWMLRKGNFPSILILRRYIKIISRYCESENLMDKDIDSISWEEMPFSIANLPVEFPPLSELVMWVEPR